MGTFDLSDSFSESWAIRPSGTVVELVLSTKEMMASELGSAALGRFALDFTTLEADQDIPADITRRARLMVIEVRPDNLTSLRRIEKLRAQHPRLTIVAAVRDASISVMRTLLRAGVSDVIALPLVRRELEAIVERLHDGLSAQMPEASGEVISVIKSVGGVGATALLTQAAAIYAKREAARGRQCCVFDLDLQAGNIANYLGMTPPLTVGDLLDAGARLDTAVLQSVAAPWRDDLMVFAAPSDMMPLEAVDTDQVCEMIDLAKREYGTVFVDLPSDWTNWSLSLVARSNVILFVVQLTVASLRQAQRQLALLDRLGIPSDAIRIVANRVERKLFKQIGLSDAAQALGRPIAFSVTNDFALMMSALNEGMAIGQIKSRSTVGRDLDKMLDGVDALLGR